MLRGGGSQDSDEVESRYREGATNSSRDDLNVILLSEKTSITVQDVSSGYFIINLIIQASPEKHNVFSPQVNSALCK